MTTAEELYLTDIEKLSNRTLTPAQFSKKWRVKHTANVWKRIMANGLQAGWMIGSKSFVTPEFIDENGVAYLPLTKNSNMYVFEIPKVTDELSYEYLGGFLKTNQYYRINTVPVHLRKGRRTGVTTVAKITI